MQRDGYIKAIMVTEPLLYPTINQYGTTFNPHGLTLPSALYPEVNIRYYTYANKPGMLYYGYVKKPKPETAPVTVPAVEREKANVGERAGALALALFGVGALVYLVGNDGTLVGVADDAAIAPTIVEIGVQLYKLFTGYTPCWG